MKNLVCIVCPKGCRLSVDEHLTCSGHACPRGEAYAKKELTNPTRTLTSTVRIVGAPLPRLPVKTSAEIPKGQLFAVMQALNNVTVQAPIQMGEPILQNVLGTGADIVATRSLPKL